MNFKDYAGYYIGCRCFNTWFPIGHEEYDRNWVFSGYCPTYSTEGNPYYLENEDDVTWTDSIKLKLRKLEDATPEEMGEMRLIRDSHTNRIKKYASVTKYLTGIGIDVFGLIDAGLAIDSKTLK